jgi:hypothetical protein
MKHFKLMKGVLACLLSLALVVTCFTSVDAKADETPTKPTPVAATYNPETDCINGLTAGNVIYVLKQEKGSTLNDKSKYTEADDTTLDVSSLAKGTNKDLYLYVCSKAFEDESKGINANLVIKGQAAKKIVGAVDYTQADVATSRNVLSITATDSAKKEIANPVLQWYDEENSVWKTNEGDTSYTGAMLKAALDNGTKAVKVRMLGTANVRTSKEISVKIGKQGKAPKVKLDVKKGTLSIKNGIDFGFATKTGDEYTAPTTWYTVLPVLKDAAIKLPADSITPDYKPLDKKDANAKKAGVGDGKKAYTQYKFKNMSIETVLGADQTEDEETTLKNALSKYKAGQEVYLAVRTSATNKKPASEVSYYTLKGMTLAPLVLTEAKVAGQKVVASTTDFEKKGFSATAINYPGTKKVGNDTVLATTGFWNDFAVDETAGTNADANDAKYEFTVVKAADLSAGTIDWTTVSWKKFDAKTKITSKLKSKYALIGKKANAVEFKAKNVAADANLNSTDVLNSADVYLLIRRAGIKGKTIDDATPASGYIKLFVAKQGKTFYLVSEQSVGSEAKKYTIQFSKYNKDAEGDNKFEVDTKTATIIGWETAGKANVTVELPALEGAVYEATGENVSLTDDGKVKFNMANDADTTVTIKIKECANVTINAKYTVAAGVEGFNKTEEALVTIADGKVGNATTATIFVGSEIVVDVPTASEFTLTQGTLPTGVSIAEGKIKYTVTSSKEVTLNIPFNVAKAE